MKHWEAKYQHRQNPALISYSEQYPAPSLEIAEFISKTFCPEGFSCVELKRVPQPIEKVQVAEQLLMWVDSKLSLNEVIARMNEEDRMLAQHPEKPTIDQTK